MAWSEDEKTFYEKAAEAEGAALDAFPEMTLLKTNLTFGRESHLINFMTQCAIVGKCPYLNLVAKTNEFRYAPIHLDDVAAAAGHALNCAHPGRHVLAGKDSLTMRAIMNVLEA